MTVGGRQTLGEAEVRRSAGAAAVRVPTFQSNKRVLSGRSPSAGVHAFHCVSGSACSAHQARTDGEAWAMYRYDERARGAPPMMGVRGGRQRQATLVDRLQLLLCCICALLPGGALLVSSQGAALSSVFRPLVDALHIPLTILIFLLHPVVLAIDGRQRQRMAIGAGSDPDQRRGDHRPWRTGGSASGRFRAALEAYQACLFLWRLLLWNGLVSAPYLDDHRVDLLV